MSIIPKLIRAACSKSPALLSTMNLLVSTPVDESSQTIAQQLRSTSLFVLHDGTLMSISLDPNEITDAFLALLNIFDDLDETLNRLYGLFTTLDISPAWLQSPLLDWKRVRVCFLNRSETVLSIVEQFGQ